MTYEISTFFYQKPDVATGTIGDGPDFADIAIRDDSIPSSGIQEALEATGMVIKDRRTCYYLDELNEHGENIDEQLIADANLELLRASLHPKLHYLFF